MCWLPAFTVHLKSWYSACLLDQEAQVVNWVTRVVNARGCIFASCIPPSPLAETFFFFCSTVVLHSFGAPLISPFSLFSVPLFLLLPLFLHITQGSWVPSLNSITLRSLTFIMATVTRQPFAPLNEARLQNLTSLKNRQNGMLLTGFQLSVN